MDSEVVKSKKETEESSKGTEDELQSDKSKKAESSEGKVKGSKKKILGKKRAVKEQQQESSKRQRMEDDKETDEHEEVEVDDEVELKKHLVIVKDDDIAIDAIPLATKPPVIDIDREDLQTLWKLVKTKHGDIRPEDEHERVLWGDLKVMNRSRIGINKWYQSFALRNFDLEDMEFESTNSNTTAKLPILKLGEYEMWVIRIKQYFQIQDYALWEVIENEKQDMRNEMKARGTLLMALPNKDQLKFHSYKDAKLLMEAIEKSSETMDQTFDRLQKLITQLEIQGEIITQEDMNLKLLRSLPSEWKTRALIWRNKKEIKTISLDDLYNNLKIYEPKISRSSSTSQNPQNVAFVSSNSTNSNSSTNEADNTAYGVSAAHTQSNPTSGDNLSDAVICAFLASQPNSPQISREDLEQINPDDLEEMDLQWEMAMMTIRVRRFIKRTIRQLDVNGQRVGFDNQKWELLPIGINMALCKRIYQAEEEHPTNFVLMAHTSSGSSSSSDSEVDSCSKSCVTAYATLKEQYDSFSSAYRKSQFNLVSYKAVPPPFTGNFMPRKPDLTFMDEIVKSENLDVTTIVSPSNVKAVESNHKSANVKNNGDAVEPKTIRKNSFRPSVIENWNSNDENECYTAGGYKDTYLLGIDAVGNPQQKEYKEKGFIDSGYSRHMTGNKFYLTGYEDYDGGFVSFGDGKGRISGKGKIKRNIGFENVYFYKELKYNLFSVSQICDKKNNVLFTDTGCLVLSSYFKLLDESQVLLRV
ncbi:hypothetical protein Tco_0640538 [Tanacetum coccineum]